MDYLKDEQHYVDLYDLHTIEECLDYYWSIKKSFEKKRNKFKKYSDKRFKKEVHKITSYTVNVIKGERYRYKAEKIKEWLDRDAKIQEKYDSAIPPEDICCKECYSTTKVVSKDLLDSYEDNSQVLFMFECVKCKKRQALYEDGTEWHYKPPSCPKCNTSLKSETKDVNKVLTTIYSCPNCSYKKKDVFDFKKSREEREKKENRDRKLLIEYREDFCLNDKNGPEYLSSMDGIINLAKEWKEQEKKEIDPIYQKAIKLKKLTVTKLEELLTKSLEKEKYIKLTFDKPEIGKFVIIPFTVQDSDSRRSEYDSINNLKKLIKKNLEDTNWRLMSEGINYRLGYLYSRLKAYEHEEDLVSLV